ncbi:MAG: nucleotide exchange factor GrpE [Rickettsiales bacterium]|jgi:molecular chaperone GrpE|nr:nucleotide exchange factor GrpE [Rickettsiales bacterium]
MTTNKNNKESEKLAQVLKDIQSNPQKQEEQPAELNKLKEENTAAMEEIAQLKEQLLRMTADAENSRKRNAKQVEDASKFAINKFAQDLIEVLENLYMATDSIPNEELEQNSSLLSIYKGIEMTKTTLLKVFEKYGLKRIMPELGENFDHNYHEAVSHIEHNELPANSVTNVMRAGYSLHDRLIKPAMVVVAKTPQL